VGTWCHCMRCVPARGISVQSVCECACQSRSSEPICNSNKTEHSLVKELAATRLDFRIGKVILKGIGNGLSNGKCHSAPTRKVAIMETSVECWTHRQMHAGLNQSHCTQQLSTIGRNIKEYKLATLYEYVLVSNSCKIDQL
jgi:hypothetical protein